jgi:hypothetical protein
MRQLIVKLQSKLVVKVASEFPASEVAGGHTIPCLKTLEAPHIKLNTFANFERPSKIDLLELFFGRLKGYVDFFFHFLLSVIIQ